MGLENLDIEDLVKKAGGRLRVTTLLQKRVRELERGWPPLVDPKGRGPIQIALEEFVEDKIWLVSGQEAQELHEKRLTEERDRAQALEAARRTAELEAGPTAPGLGGRMPGR